VKIKGERESCEGKAVVRILGIELTKNM